MSVTLQTMWPSKVVKEGDNGAENDEEASSTCQHTHMNKWFYNSTVICCINAILLKYANSIPNSESPEMIFYWFSSEYLPEWWELYDKYMKFIALL